jgi:hypothetical protein
MAAVDAAGLVTCLNRGDTHIVAFYDNGVATVPVMLPVSDRVGDRYPSVPTPTKIDELVVAKLKKLGIVPSELCTDAEFLRRVSLDMTGTLPTAGEVSQFLADNSSSKRSKKVDELLSRPTFAAWWATRLCDILGNTERTAHRGEQALNREKRLVRVARTRGREHAVRPDCQRLVPPAESLTRPPTTTRG